MKDVPILVLINYANYARTMFDFVCIATSASYTQSNTSSTKYGFFVRSHHGYSRLNDRHVADELFIPGKMQLSVKHELLVLLVSVRLESGCELRLYANWINT